MEPFPQLESGVVFKARLQADGGEATVYGKCIASNTTEHGNLKKDVCAKEFAMLMDCFTEAAKKNVKT
ncbi:putative C17orf89-like protein [Naja naja]|nr:putative C17orf89-like protein [Naja naja]